jgi:hypothetical protein
MARFNATWSGWTSKRKGASTISGLTRAITSFSCCSNRREYADSLPSGKSRKVILFSGSRRSVIAATASSRRRAVRSESGDPVQGSKGTGDRLPSVAKRQ